MGRAQHGAPVYERMAVTWTQGRAVPARCCGTLIGILAPLLGASVSYSSTASSSRNQTWILAPLLPWRFHQLLSSN